MCRHGENIYKRRDGRYEGRYIIGKNAQGKTRFGYVYGYQYTEVRRKLAERKAATASLEIGSSAHLQITLREWMLPEICSEGISINERDCFDKGAQYREQNEWRIALYRGEKSTTTYKLNVGNLSDIVRWF